jgi:hypothetical protein
MDTIFSDDSLLSILVMHVKFSIVKSYEQFIKSFACQFNYFSIVYFKETSGQKRPYFAP